VYKSYTTVEQYTAAIDKQTEGVKEPLVMLVSIRDYGVGCDMNCLTSSHTFFPPLIGGEDREMQAKGRIQRGNQTKLVHNVYTCKLPEFSDQSTEAKVLRILLDPKSYYSSDLNKGKIMALLTFMDTEYAESALTNLLKVFPTEPILASFNRSLLLEEFMKDYWIHTTLKFDKMAELISMDVMSKQKRRMSICASGTEQGTSAETQKKYRAKRELVGVYDPHAQLTGYGSHINQVMTDQIQQKNVEEISALVSNQQKPKTTAGKRGRPKGKLNTYYDEETQQYYNTKEYKKLLMDREQLMIAQQQQCQEPQEEYVEFYQEEPPKKKRRCKQ